MGYYTFNKIRKEKIEYFNKCWQAAAAIDEVYDVPEGYTFKSDVYCIVDEDGNPAVIPEEEKKPFSISYACGEVPPEFFHEDKVNCCGDDEYGRTDFFDTFEEAEEALKKYKSVRCDIEINGNEFISYGQFFIESKNKVLKVADWDEKEQNWTMLPESYFTEKR